MSGPFLGWGISKSRVFIRLDFLCSHTSGLVRGGVRVPFPSSGW